MTFRVRDKIFVITGHEQARAQHPDEPRAAGGPDRRLPRRVQERGLRRAVRLGQRRSREAPDDVVRDVIEGAWLRTAPRKTADAYRAARDGA